MASAPIDVQVKVKGLNDLQKLERRMQALEKEVEQLTGDLTKANKKIAQLNTEAAKASIGVGKLSKQFKSFAATLIAAGTAQALFNTGLDRIQSNARLIALARAYDEIEQAQAAATRTAEAFNLSQTEANKQFAAIYGRLRPLGLTVNQIEDAYAGLTTAVKTASLDAGQAAALFTQVSQALGSGVVQAEELNTVIDQSPAIVVALGKELGVTANEVKALTRTGQVSSEALFKALLRVKEEGVDVLSESLNTPAEKIKAFYNTTEDIVSALTTAVIPELVDGVDDIAAALNALLPLAQVVGRTLSAAFRLAALPAKAFGDLLANIAKGDWEAVLKFNPRGQELSDIFSDLFAPLPEIGANASRRSNSSADFPTIPNRGGSGSSTKEAEKLTEEAAKRAEAMRQGVLSAERMLALSQSEAAVLSSRNRVVEAELQAQLAKEEIAIKYAKLAEESLSVEQTSLYVQAQTQEIKNEDLKLTQQILDIEEAAIGPSEQKLRLLKARLAGTEKEAQLEIDIENAIKGQPAYIAEIVEANMRNAAVLEKQVEQLDAIDAIYEQVGTKIKDGIVDSITAAVEGSKDLQQIWSDILRDIGKLLIRQGLGALGGDGGLFGADGLPGFANGGLAPANKPALVGEKGPEIITPLSPTLVTPFDATREAVANSAAGIAADDAFVENAAVIGAGAATMAEKSATRQQAAMAASPGTGTIKFETFSVGGIDVVSRAEAIDIGRQAAKTARAQVFNDLKNKPSARAGVGL